MTMRTKNNPRRKRDREESFDPSSDIQERPCKRRTCSAVSLEDFDRLLLAHLSQQVPGLFYLTSDTSPRSFDEPPIGNDPICIVG